MRKNITQFLNLGVMTRNKWLNEIKASNDDYQSFNRSGNASFYRTAYHWLEKLRLAQGLYKTPQRIRNEINLPNGFDINYETETSKQPTSHHSNTNSKNGKETSIARKQKKYEPRKIPNRYDLFAGNERDNDMKMEQLDKCHVCGSSEHSTENCMDIRQVFEDNIKTNNHNNIEIKLEGGPNMALMNIWGNKCQKCGEYGHWRASCKSKKQNACFNCKREGHWARDCPFKNRYF